MSEVLNSNTEISELSGAKKAAIFLVSLGASASAEIYKFLSDDQVERLSNEIARLESVPSSMLTLVNEEYYQMMLAQKYIAAGGIGYAQEVLLEALGETRAMEVLKKVQMSMVVKGFNVLQKVDSNQLLAFLQKEHPQTISLVLSQLNPMQSANILTELPPISQVDVMFRLAQMERVNPETLEAVERVLESRIDFDASASVLGGVQQTADILNMVGQRFEKNILSGIAKENPDLASEIKNLMFVFEDVINLDDRSIQKVLREVDNKELAMALKTASEELKAKILANMSARASEMIEEELQYMGPVRLKEVEEVQQRIIDIIRRLEEEGQIVVAVGTVEEQMV
ncbi:MAG: flagellar motor switch protein FliG [Candidatus Electryonea clarkiae]|nr:flagellar motor switch protein FliG [Candidatus Electryonea clarkiae]